MKQKESIIYNYLKLTKSIKFISVNKKIVLKKITGNPYSMLYFQ